MFDRDISADENNSEDLSMSQHIINSPGAEAYQAGRDLHIYKGPKKRTISEQKQQEMVQILQPLAGSKIDIDFVGGAETRRLAQQIKEIFLLAGWETGNICKVANASYENVSIRIKGPNTYPKRMEEVKKALEIAGFNVPIYADKRKDENAVAICIGDQI